MATKKTAKPSTKAVKKAAAKRTGTRSAADEQQGAHGRLELDLTREADARAAAQQGARTGQRLLDHGAGPTAAVTRTTR